MTILRKPGQPRYTHKVDTLTYTRETPHPNSTEYRNDVKYFSERKRSEAFAITRDSGLLIRATPVFCSL